MSRLDSKNWTSDPVAGYQPPAPLEAHPHADLEARLVALQAELDATQAELTDLSTAYGLTAAALDRRIREPGASFPASPSDGAQFYETDTNIHWTYTDGAWRRTSSTALAHFRWVAASGTKSGTSYSDFPGPIDLAFTKHSTATSLIIHMCGSSYADANQVTNIGVRINSTDFDVCYFFHNSAGRHDSFSAINVGFSGLAAGAYTARMRWKNSAGAGNITVDGNDLFSLLISENVP